MTMLRSTTRRRKSGAAVLRALCWPGFLSLLLAAGCLGEPTIEEQWTILEMASPARFAGVASGAATEVTVTGHAVYRSILTGAIVAEVRVSDTVPLATVNLDPEGDRVPVMQEVDRILQNSVSAGFEILPFTGWDHLIQDFEIAVSADIPSTAPPGGGVFLLVYLADFDEVELATGEEIIVVTPFDFQNARVLPIGIELVPGSGGS